MVISKGYCQALICWLALLVQARTQGLDLDGCLEYEDGLCIRCDENSHLDGGYCYQNVPWCLAYSGGSNCSLCDTIYSTLQSGNCVLKPGVSTVITGSGQISSATGNPGDRYGEINFMFISLEDARAKTTFNTLNTFMRTGQYKHFISRVQNPIYSVHYYRNGTADSYKILYEGSGGGLYLCIADVDVNNLKIGLRALVTIAVTRVIDYCIDYSNISIECLRCQEGYHLEEGKCYQNYGGCIKYLANICLQCANYYLLVENRCISDCISVSDGRSILFFDTQSTSSLERTYRVSLNIFYRYYLLTTTTSSTNSGGAIILNGTTATTTTTTNVTTTSATVQNRTTTSTFRFVENCNRYALNGTCQACSPGYRLQEQACQSIL